MSLWNKILIGLIAVASIAFLYFAMRTLSTVNAWRTAHNTLVKKIEQEEQKTLELTGKLGGATRGILQAKRELHEVLVGRGRVWRNVAPGAIDPTGAVSVSVEDPQPHQIAENLVLYVFDDRPIAEGGRYLGEFKVAQVAEKQVALTPAWQLTPAELKTLQGATGPWALYDVMPPDSHKVFADLNEEDLKGLFPGDQGKAYLKDGKPAEANDPPELVQGGNYVRPLNDYAVLFRNYLRLRSQYVDLIEAAKKDKQYIENALADTKQDEQFRRQEIEDLKVQLVKSTAERDAVKAFRESLDTALADTRELIAQLAADNQRLAAQYAAWQANEARAADAAAARALGTGPSRGSTTSPRPPAARPSPR